MHYRRWKDYGDVNFTKRPEDWGERKRHPLHGTWDTTRRGAKGRVERWDDFNLFLEDVPERKSGYRFFKIDKGEPWGPDNFYWRENDLDLSDAAISERERRNEHAKSWRKNNPLRWRHHYLKGKYGIGIDDYFKMLGEQDSKCAICKTKSDKALHVDHCHKTRAVRGLLCNGCNTALGLFRESEKNLLSGIEYIRKYKGE
jgi:hypothetical protein